ncbi:hypothetical protein [Microbispora sp. NPDC049125]|uniref:hypothetical protein n=1 Tax=Microbispora sp. NPDC049125 TaxID=3154929 RepID=UPI0034668D03
MKLFRGSPMSSLATYARLMAAPEIKRRSYWRPLIGGDNWAILVIWRGRAGEPPERPQRAPAPMLNPDWLERSGAGLQPKDLLYKRIRDRLRAHTQDRDPLTAEDAAAIAAAAAWAAMQELNYIPQEDTNGC